MRRRAALAASLLAALSFGSATAADDPFAPGKPVELRSVVWQGGDALVTVGLTHVAVWEVSSGKRRSVHALGGGAAHPLTGSPVSADGKRLLVTAGDGPGRVVSLDGKADVPLTPLPKGGPLRFLSWSPDGGRLLFVDGEAVPHLWDAANGKYAGRLGGPLTDPAQDRLSFGPSDGFFKTRYSGTLVGDNRLESTSSVRGEGESYGTEGEAEAWSHLTWSPDGRYLLTMAQMDAMYGIVVVWDGRTGTALASLSVPGRHYSQWAFSPDGSRLALLTADMTRRAVGERADEPWDKEIRRHEAAPHAVTLRILDPQTGAVLRRLDGDFLPHRFAWSPDSKQIVTAGMPLSEFGRTRELTCFDAATGRRLWSRPDPSPDGKVYDLSYGPDGKRLAVMTFRPPNGDAGPQLLLLKAESGKQIAETRFADVDFARPLPAWSPVGGRVLIAGHVRDADGRRLFDLKETPTGAAWDPTGKVLAVWTRGTPVRLVSAEDGKQLRQLPEEK